MIGRKTEIAITGAANIVGRAISAAVDTAGNTSSTGADGQIVIAITAEIVGTASIALLNVTADTEKAVVGNTSGGALTAIILGGAKGAASHIACNANTLGNSEASVASGATVGSGYASSTVSCVTLVACSSELTDSKTGLAARAKVRLGALGAIVDIEFKTCVLGAQQKTCLTLGAVK